MTIGITIISSRTDVEVIPRVARLLPSFGYKCPEVTLVRTFVGRETDIAIDSIGTILGGKVGYSRVENRNLLDDFFHQFMETSLVFQELVLVGIEPLAVVVGLQLTEIGDDCFHTKHFMILRVNKNTYFLPIYDSPSGILFKIAPFIDLLSTRLSQVEKL